MEMGVGRELKVKINNNEHTVVAKPDDCIRKEEVITPPYNYHAPLRFTFLVGECTGQSIVNETKSKIKVKKHRNH